jgi:type IV pilus assembly protein PilB
MKTAVFSSAQELLAERLLLDGHLNEKQIASVFQEANTSKVSFLTCLLRDKHVNSSILAHTVSETFSLPLLDLNACKPEIMPLHLVSEKLIRQHEVFPLFLREKQLFIAIADPTRQAALDEIKFHTGLLVQCVLVEINKLKLLIEHCLAAKNSRFSVTLPPKNPVIIEQTSSENFTSIDTDETPIIRFVSSILLDAVEKGASDIHFEPFENTYRIRMRQDGILYDVISPPTDLAQRVTTRLKVISNLDISERRIPQDGRFKFTLANARVIDFRINTCPTLHGEKIVLRILNPVDTTLHIDALGCEPLQIELFLSALKKPQGMILVTGPTGSGKTVSLYTALSLLNTSEINILTIEDPVEIHLPGINQVNVNPKVGLTFTSALRTFLRQDPDVIMVGEMRDHETADIGIKAAQTGHLVLSTLHTNNTLSALTRLLNMGIPAYNIASSVSLIIAQRLIRKLCAACKEPDDPHAFILQGFSKNEIQDSVIYKPVGCAKCYQGYRGRTGIYELLPVNDDFRATIMSCDITQLAEQGKFQSLKTSGLNKVKQGITSLSELNRVMCNTHE